MDFVHNLWYDFGLCKGGSIIDLVMQLQGCNAHEAMSQLVGNNLSFYCEAISAPRKEEQQTSKRRILSISEELPPHLQHYLQEVRKIDLNIAKPHLRSVCYEVGDRTYTAIGFLNQSGGYELRDNKSFKGTLAPKDISVIGETDEQQIKGHSEAIKRTSNIAYNFFEGFMDFLSYLTMKGEETKTPSIVLNFVSNVHRAIAYLREHHITSVRAFFDNDEAGRQALQSLQSAGIHIEDMSRYYGGNKDLNEYHVARQRAMEQRSKIVRPSTKPIAKRGFHR